MLFSFLLPVSGLLIQDISSPAAGIAFLWFLYDHGVIWVCSYIAPIAPSMDICVLCITQSTSSLFYRLLFAICHLHLSVAYFYPAARNRIFFTKRLTSGSRRVAFIKLFLFFNDMPSFCILFPFAYYLTMPAARDEIFFRKKTNFRQQAWSLPILFLCLSFMTDVFSFTVISLCFHLLFIYIVRNWYIRLFSLLTSTYCLLLCTDCCRKPVFFCILSLIPAAALAPLICMHFSFVIFALISYRWYFLFITHKFSLFSCICIIYNWYLFYFTAILHTFFFIYIIYDWHTFFSYLFCYTVFCYVLTAAGSRSSFGYYHLSRQQLLLCFICMHCFSITYVWCAYSFRTRYLITYIWCFFFAHMDFPTVLIIRSAIFITYRCLSISGMETITLLLLSLIYDVFSNLSIIFASLISDDFSSESGSRTHCMPYICGYFYLLYMMYIRFISSFISDNHLKIRWSTVPSCLPVMSTVSIITVGTAIDICTAAD